MQRINEDIKTGNFKQIYLLYGEERYLKNQYTTRLRKALCQDGDEMNTHFYQGKDFSLGQVIDLAETLPFLAERRVMFFKDTGLFKSGGEKLAEYLANPNDTTFFVFTESEVDKRSKLYKTVQSKGYVAEFTVQDENSLKRWIAGILGREEKNLREHRTAPSLQDRHGYGKYPDGAGEADLLLSGPGYSHRRGCGSRLHHPHHQPHLRYGQCHCGKAAAESLAALLRSAGTEGAAHAGAVPDRQAV